MGSRERGWGRRERGGAGARGVGLEREGWGWSERDGAGIEWEQETKVYNHIIWQILQKEIGGGGSMIAAELR